MSPSPEFLAAVEEGRTACLTPGPQPDNPYGAAVRGNRLANAWKMGYHRALAERTEDGPWPSPVSFYQAYMEGRAAHPSDRNPYRGTTAARIWMLGRRSTPSFKATLAALGLPADD